MKQMRSMYTGINRNWGYSRLNFSLFNDLQEIPDGSRDSITRQFTKQISEADTFRPIVSKSELNSYKISVLHQHIQHYRLYSTSDIYLGDSKIGIIIGYQIQYPARIQPPTRSGYSRIRVAS